MRALREQYEAVSESKVIGSGSIEKSQEESDMIELVNAIRVAENWYQSLLLEMDVLRGIWNRQ